MKRFIKVYCEDLKQEIKIPIEINIENDVSRCQLTVNIPEQHFCVGHEFVYAAAYMVEERTNDND